MGIAYGMDIKLRPRDLPHQSPARKCFYLSFLLAVSVGGLRLNVIFAALKISSMSIVHTLLNGSPVLVMLLSHCMLNKQDPFTKMKAFASVLLLIGIVLNTNPLEAIDEAVRELLRTKLDHFLKLT